MSVGYQKSKVDRCLYFRNNGNRHVAIVAIYVVDMLLASNNDSWIDETVKLLRNELKMQVIHDPKSFIRY